MKYETHDSIKFCIPDTWLVESGLTETTLTGDCCFVSEDAEQVLDIQLISSPVRSPGVRWFYRENMLPILTAFVSHQSLPPIDIHSPPQRPHQYQVRDGFHRYYASVAAGFRKIPIRILEYFDINTLQAE